MAHGARTCATRTAIARSPRPPPQRGPLKVWVNNAGILRTAKAWEHTDDEVRLLVEANFLGVLWGSRAAVEAMRALGGDIVNMASMSSFGAVPGPRRLRRDQARRARLHDVAAGRPRRRPHPDPHARDLPRRRGHRAWCASAQAEEDAAIIFSTPRFLRPEEVAEQIVAVIGERRPVAIIPRSRGVLVRAMALFPRLSLRLLPMFKKAGQKKREKERLEAAA